MTNRNRPKAFIAGPDPALASPQECGPVPPASGPAVKNLLLCLCLGLALSGCAALPDAWNQWNKSSCAYLYSDWSACADGKQTRSVTASTPEGCKGTPVLEQVCEMPPEPPASESADAIDPASVAWDEPAGDVGAWPITATITRAAVEGGKLKFAHAALTWPTKQKNGWDKPARGNVWVIARCADGKWHGATVEWLLDQQEIRLPRFDGTDDIHGCVGTDFRPTAGTEGYAMLSAFARGGAWTVKERSQTVGVTWP